jgi:hypothetical protein
MSQQVRLHECIESYLVFRQSGFAANTVSNEGFVLRRFAAWAGDIQLRHLTANKVAEWLCGPQGLRSEHTTRDGIRREAIQPSTHNNYRNRLASLFRYARQRGLLRVRTSCCTSLP